MHTPTGEARRGPLGQDRRAIARAYVGRRKRDGDEGLVDNLKILRYINITAMILVAVFNVVDGIDQGKGAAECLLFSAPFLVAAGVLIFAKSYKVNAWLYAAAGLAITATGSKGNFAGAIYIIFSFYIFNSAITNYALVGVTVFTIVCRYLFMGHSVPATINLLIAYAFTFGVYFVLMHPKPEPKPVVAHVDDVTIEVVKYVQD
jgi:hypothetical protein